MIRQLIRLTFSAAVIGLLALLLSPSARGRQVGVKAEPPPKPSPKTNAPIIKPTKRPVAPRAVPKGTKPKLDEPLTSTYPVLSRIEKYKAPAFPKSQHLDREPYDYRILHKAAVPATLTDVLVCDIWQRATDLKLSLSTREPAEETIKQAMNVYLTKSWTNISGYRPWAHWNFIHGLNESERETLARDVARYIAKNGVRDVKK
ncbi:MAG: hypothetical protein ACJ74J_09640 [Blastocatellia bacterium]